MEPKRTSHTQLPGSSEIAGIVAAEAKRQKPAVKIGVRYVNFSDIIKLYKHFGVDYSFFEDKGEAASEILDIGDRSTKELVKLIHATEPTPQEVNLFNQAYDYLAEEDELTPADFIFVFGNKAPLRTQKAIELYKNGLGQKIIFSGHVPSYADKSTVAEAQLHAELAIKSGVPKEAILIEKDSITMPDNIRRSLNMLDKNKTTYTSFMLVNSPYSQRRGWCVFKKYTLDNVKILRANSQTRPEYQRDEWYKNPDGLAIVLGEYIKLRNAVTFDDA